jgi:hypothetical protein
MFRCDIGGEPVGPRVAPIKIVTQKRSRDYSSSQGLSYGWEIVKEVSVCREHAQKHADEEVKNAQ